MHADAQANVAKLIVCLPKEIGKWGESRWISANNRVQEVHEVHAVSRSAQH
jgi:hypothetical protein